MEKLLVSGCLLGHPCRYDGKAKRNEAVCALREKWELISVCPETMGGLKAPREPAEQRMVDGCRRVISRDGRDLTAFFEKGAQRVLDLALEKGCRFAVLKENSPSCGCGCIYDGTFTGVLYEDDLAAAQSFYCDRLGLPLLGRQADALLLQAGDAQLLLRRRPAGCTLGPSMIGLEASSVNKLYDRFSQSPDYKEAGVLRDTDFDARRLFQMYDPSGNVVEIYAYLRNVREEILMH